MNKNDSIVKEFEDKIYFYDYEVNKSSRQLDEAITECVLSSFENHYITEKAEKSLVVRIKEFFARLVSSFRHFCNELKNRFTAAIRKKEYKLSLERSKAKLIKAKEDGERTVELQDVWSYKKLYKNYGP